MRYLRIINIKVAFLLLLSVFFVMPNITYAISQNASFADILNTIYVNIYVYDEEHKTPLPNVRVRVCSVHQNTSGRVVNEKCGGCSREKYYTDKEGKVTVRILGTLYPSNNWILVRGAGYERYCQPMTLRAEGTDYTVLLHKSAVPKEPAPNNVDTEILEIEID